MMRKLLMTVKTIIAAKRSYIHNHLRGTGWIVGIRYVDFRIGMYGDVPKATVWRFSAIYI